MGAEIPYACYILRVEDSKEGQYFAAGWETSVWHSRVCSYRWFIFIKGWELYFDLGKFSKADVSFARAGWFRWGEPGIIFRRQFLTQQFLTRKGFQRIGLRSDNMVPWLYSGPLTFAWFTALQYVIGWWDRLRSFSFNLGRGTCPVVYVVAPFRMLIV